MQNDNEKFKNDFKNRLYQFVLRLIKFIGLLPHNAVTKVIIDQTIRSGTSVLANYVEAKAASSRREFTNFFQYSLKSANETKVWLSLLKDSGNCDAKEEEILLQEITEIANILASSIIKLKGKK